jgi:hypothetical protein
MENNQERNTIIINLIGGPCSTKSTTAAGVFHKLKCAGYEAELVTEYAKELTWQGHNNVLNNQSYVSCKQINRLYKLNGKVDIIINDSPILLGIIYQGFGCTPSFRPWLMEVFGLFNNLNFFLKRRGDYNPLGRNQDYEGALKADKAIIDLLHEEEVTYFPFEVDNTVSDRIFEKIKYELEKDKKVELPQGEYLRGFADEDIDAGDVVIIDNNTGTVREV